jgi:hypothetical protein
MSFDKLRLFGNRLAKEPPFRLFTRYLVKTFGTSIRTKARWDAVARPQYLTGILAAADQAARENVDAFCAIEFGVARGDGLVTMQEYAAAVEKETGIRILVYGFDSGQGLPAPLGDHRDHPDQWRSGDYRMDEAALRRRLTPRTELILGDVRETVPKFVDKIQKVPIGFLAMDLDLHSSTQAALQVLCIPNKKMLRRVPMYFDDVRYFFNHRFAGELLAIDEFNQLQQDTKIDVWRGLLDGRVFHEDGWLQNMFVAHDLKSISNVQLQRAPATVVP